MPKIATLTLFGLSEAEKRSVVIADNRIPEQATWDFQALKSNFSALIEIDFDVELTGFRQGFHDQSRARGHGDSSLQPGIRIFWAQRRHPAQPMRVACPAPSQDSQNTKHRLKHIRVSVSVRL
jgi:hypothetical protein